MSAPDIAAILAKNQTLDIFAAHGQTPRYVKGVDFPALGTSKTVTSAVNQATTAGGSAGTRRDTYVAAYKAFAERGRTCEDDSRPIPCDGKTHERTFGPAQPAWQDPSWLETPENIAAAAAGDPMEDATTAAYFAAGPGGRFRQQHGQYRAEPPNAARKAISSSDVTRHAIVIMRGGEMAGSDKEKVRSLLRWIGEDGTGLRRDVLLWIQSITCERPARKELWCEYRPDVVENGTEGGEPYFIDDFVEHIGVNYRWYSVCIKALFRCKGGIRIPAVPCGQPSSMTGFAMVAPHAPSSVAAALSSSSAAGQKCACDQCDAPTLRIERAIERASWSGAAVSIDRHGMFWASAAMFDAVVANAASHPEEREIQLLLGERVLTAQGHQSRRPTAATVWS